MNAPSHNDGIDAEEFRSEGSSNPLSFQYLVMEQVRRIAKLGSIEFRGGYWETPEQGYDKQQYIPASHESFSEAVQTLANMLHDYLDEKVRKDIAAELEKLEEDVKKWESKNDDKLPVEAERHWRASAHRRIFRKLCGALKELNYLEGSGEGADDE